MINLRAIEMDIVTLLNLTGAGATQGTNPSIEPIDDMFALMLAQAQSPPGPEPPPDLALAGKGNEKQLKVEPNAQSETPDLLPNENLVPLIALQISSTQQLPEAAVIPAQLTTSDAVVIDPAVQRVDAGQIADLTAAKDLNFKSLDVQKPLAPEAIIVEAEKSVAPEEIQLELTDQPAQTIGSKPIPPQVNAGHTSDSYETELKQQIHTRNDKVTQGSDLFRKDGKITPVAKSAVAPETAGITPLKTLAAQTTEPLQREVVVATIATSTSESTDSESATFGGENQQGQQEAQGLPTLEFRERVEQAGKLQKSEFEIFQGLSRRDTNAVVRQLADRLEFLAATDNSEGVTIQLDPRELGSMTLVVKSQGSEIQAQVSTENEAVKAAIAANRPQLQESLQNKGLTLTNLSLNTSLSDKQQGQQQQQNQSQQQSWFAGNAANQSMHFGNGAHAVHNSKGSNAKGVDLWI